MLSEISSIFDLFDKLFEVFTKKSIKSIVVLLTLLSIVLIKPAVYYSTLYEKFCNVSLLILISLIVFFIGYITYHKKHNEYYDKETMQILLSVITILVILIFFGYLEQKDYFCNFFNDKGITEIEFITTIHNLNYFEELYMYVFSDFLTILFYCLELVQMVSFTYFILFIFNRLLFSEEPLKYGIPQGDFNIIITNCFIIVVTSPIFYETFSNFWNKIF